MPGLNDLFELEMRFYDAYTLVKIDIGIQVIITDALIIRAIWNMSLSQTMINKHNRLIAT